MKESAIRIGALLHKEWLELHQLRALIFGAVGLPLLFTVIPLGVLYGVRLAPEIGSADIERALALMASDPMFAALGAAERIQVAMGRPMSMMILLLPVMIPSMVASYSIVGEKSSQTLEPLLATPIRTWELLLGKMLTAFIPTLVLTWLFAGLFALGVRGVALSDEVFRQVTGGAWPVAVLVLAPALSMLAIAVTVGISSRSRDPRSAQEVSALLVMPIILLIPAQLGGLLLIGTELVIGATIAIVALAAIAIWTVQRLFDREWILTRWR